MMVFKIKKDRGKWNAHWGIWGLYILILKYTIQNTVMKLTKLIKRFFACKPLETTLKNTWQFLTLLIMWLFFNILNVDTITFHIPLISKTWALEVLLLMPGMSIVFNMLFGIYFFPLRGSVTAKLVMNFQTF